MRDGYNLIVLARIFYEDAPWRHLLILKAISLRSSGIKSWRCSDKLLLNFSS